ncbi:DUF2207 domain-containing protein [Roseibium sp.]|uniref:DUF2207 domain-containing protein n=1 Tax=Roseibium sp. TaxID=1936156 RepID=UPI003A977CE2
MPGFRISRRLTAFVVGCLTFFAALTHALADERILNFGSTIAVAHDGTLTVTEKITVTAEGNKIKRGIYRDIPLTFEDADGREKKAGFELLEVLRDGRPDSYTVKRANGGVRIYVGKEDVLLRPGTYTYTLRYETTRQIRFFDDHDEVYWNATGNEWIFPIDQAQALVILPEGDKATRWTAFTGRYGSRESAVTVTSEDGDNSVLFKTTRGLGPQEGLTVVVAMPKGVVAPPTREQEAAYFLMDYRAEIIGSIGVLLVLAYYLIAWWQVGRDPPKGVIFPRFKAPEGISPALANYVTNRGFGDGGWKALSAACLNLAVKGRLVLEAPGDTVKLVPKPDGNPRNAWDDPLPRGESAVNRWLRNRGSPLTINKDNGKSVQTLGRKFRSAIESESRARYFKKNWGYVIPGAILSVLAAIALVVFGNLSEDQIALFMPVLFIGVFVTVFSVNFGKLFRRSGNIFAKIAAIFMIFGFGMSILVSAVPILFSGSFGIPLLPALAVALVASNLLFYYLLGAPTVAGRQVLDEIEGLKLYLTVAEKDRMNMEGAPEMSPSHFETLLPYAVALGVEKPWSNAFQAWLLTAAGAAVAASYAPAWYSGQVFDGHNIAGSMNDVTSAMAGSFSTSLPAPKSSSSGFSSGGGFSGGGGGGGGGGGW